MRISAALPQGVTAFLFEAARRRRELESRLVKTLEGEDFSEVILPILDYLEPYEPLLGASSRGELYRFVDRDGELLALRSDFTPMLARILAPRLHTLELPLKVFYRGDVVRYEEERAGRQRELFQLGAELLGEEGDEAEREMLGLFLRLVAVESPEGEGVSLVLGFAGALDDLLLAAADDLPPAQLAAAVRRRERAVVRDELGATPGVAGALLAVMETGVPERPEDLGPAAAERLRALREQVAEVAADFPRARLSVDLAEFGLHTLDERLESQEESYYDGLVFHGYAGGGALPVGGGGRYDRLFAHLGTAVPAVGFTLGLDRLIRAGDGADAGPAAGGGSP